MNVGFQRLRPMAVPGFTLVEMLVAMAVLSALIVLLFSVVNQTARAWNRAEQRVDAFREARAALYVIRRDLQTAIEAPDLSSADGTPVPDGKPDYPTFFVNPDPANPASCVKLAGAAKPEEGDILFFISAQPQKLQPPGSKSDACIVGFYLAYTANPPAGAAAPASSFKLYRHSMNSDATFARLDPFIKGITPLAQASPITDEILASNVVRFRVKPYDASLKSPEPPKSWPAEQVPAIVEVTLTAFNNSVANAFAERSDWFSPSLPLVRQSRQDFTTRVAIQRP